MIKNKLDFIKIYDGHSETIGANQYWFNQKFAALSGCGPTTASEILAYLTQRYPEATQGLYPHGNERFDRRTFVQFMQEVREYVKPTMMGLTDIDFYTDQTIRFAGSRDVQLEARQIDPELDASDALNSVAETIDGGLPLAMLILTNPNPDIREYTWHWMTIIGYDKSNGTVTIATHGKTHVLNFLNAWVNSAYVYILICADDTLYTGWTTDVERRVAEHNTGKKGSRYTRARRPVRLAYTEICTDSVAAMQREAQIKKLSRGQKLELIEASKTAGIK